MVSSLEFFTNLLGLIVIVSTWALIAKAFPVESYIVPLLALIILLVDCCLVAISFKYDPFTNCKYPILNKSKKKSTNITIIKIRNLLILEYLEFELLSFFILFFEPLLFKLSPSSFEFYWLLFYINR